MIKIGKAQTKSGAKNALLCSVLFAAFVASGLTIGLTSVQAQTVTNGPEISGWKAPDKPGDGKAEVVLADGATPAACRIAISTKGASCSKVVCKGEQSVFTNSSQSILAAKRISLSIAKAHYVHFLQEEINSKRATDIIDGALKKEGGPDAGTSASSGYIASQNIREQASALIKGFSVIEDGITTDESGGKVAYTIGGVSCVTQNAADNLRNGNSTNSGTNGQGNNNNNGGQQAAPADSRRRAMDNM
jgi:hypothetical protein